MARSEADLELARGHLIFTLHRREHPDGWTAEDWDEAKALIGHKRLVEEIAKLGHCPTRPQVLQRIMAFRVQHSLRELAKNDGLE